MSDITTETWIAVGSCVERQSDGETLVDCFGGSSHSEARAKAIATLPRALTLLERVMTNRSLTAAMHIEDEAEVLLREAGVLP